LLIETGVVPANKLTNLTNESNELVAILTSIVKKSRSVG
jgi:hypothetical protein